MDAELEINRIMKKLNKKQQAIIVELLKELHHYKEENDELVDLFVTQKCFSGIKESVENRYKRCKQKLPAPTADESSQINLI